MAVKRFERCCEMEFRYFFEDKGAIAPAVLLPNQIWVDIGNKAGNGIFDNHRQGGERSSFESIFAHPGYLEPAGKYILSCREKHKTPVIEFHMHKYPDLDCIACVFVIQKILKEGLKKPADVLGENAACQMLEYVNEIDCGRKKYLSSLNVYAFICMLGEKDQTIIGRSKEILSEGLKLLELVAEALKNRSDSINLFTAPLQDYIDISKLGTSFYEKAKRKLEETRLLYEKDKKDKRVSFRTVKVWNRRENREDDITAAIWEKLPYGEDGYIFARELDACLLTVYPYSIRKEGKNEVLTSVTIALNPDREVAKSYTLLPLAEIFEQCEQIEEGLLYDQTGRFRRDHSRPREVKGRFAAEPFSETSDPWFISEEEDMVDVPRGGSLIYYEQILSIIENASFMVRDVNIIKYRYPLIKKHLSTAEQSGKYQRISFGNLYTLTRNMLTELREETGQEYLLAFVRIHPDKLRYNNILLKNVCLSMVGKSNSGMNEDNVLYLDYRTCLYADQTISIIVEADTKNQALRNILGIKDEEVDFLNSDVCLCLNRIIEHRHSLRMIGTQLPEMMNQAGCSENAVEELNAKLVSLNTVMQKDDIIPESNMQEIYSFVRKKLGIEDLKQSVFKSSDFLIQKEQQESDRKEEERDRGLQTILGLFAILGVFSALTDGWDIIYRWFVGGEWGKLSKYGILAECVVIILVVLIGAVTARYAFPVVYEYIKNHRKNGFFRNE